jgi:hypothetical protein
MFHRFSTWWRALSVVLLSLATVTWPSAAQASTTPTFTLLHQDVVAALSSQGTSHFSATIRIAPNDPQSRAQVAIFSRLIQRSQIAPIVSGAGITGPPTAITRAFALNCVSRGTVRFRIGLFTRRPGTLRGPCGASAANLRLNCRGQRCDGVYPLKYTITTKGATVTKWSLLTVQTTSVAQPLRVDLVATLGPSSLIRSHRAASVLDVLGQHAASQVTLSADYRTLSNMQGTSAESSLLRTALNKALASPLHQAVDAPPSTIDFAGLMANGLADQVRAQLLLSSNLLKSLTGRYVDGPVLLSGTPSVASVAALGRVGAGDLVIPEGDLALAPSSTLSWGAPFHVPGAASVSALSTDAPLSSLVADESIEPGLRTVLTLATLDFLHFEAPYAPAVRTVVIVAPVAKTSASFVADLLNGFERDPFAQLVTLSPSFSNSLIGANGSPTSRSLQSTSTSLPWSGHNVNSLTALIAGVTSYSQAVTSSNVGNALRVAVALSERTGDPDARQVAINAASDSLAGQLDNFSVDPSAITLAGPGTSLPITLLSRANYTVTAVVHLVTDRLSFPKGKDVVIVMDAPTKSVRIPTSKHQGSSLTLQVVVTTPDNQIVLARAAIQVRIAGTSIVGYFLTAASLLVLAYWWLRTHRRRRSRGRHAR